ncbi:hypothetical protein ABIB62_004190 [Mucilaginibacter sp. UYP25]
MVAVLATVKPAQVPQEKNGEQPAQSLALLAAPCSVLTPVSQSLSVQHGFTDRKKTTNENRMQSSFTTQKYHFKFTGVIKLHGKRGAFLQQFCIGIKFAERQAGIVENFYPHSL